jgi:hypothetical protein
VTGHCRHRIIASHRIASHRIASHRIASHRIASHRIASHHGWLWWCSGVAEPRNIVKMFADSSAGPIAQQAPL